MVFFIFRSSNLSVNCRRKALLRMSVRGNSCSGLQGFPTELTPRVITCWTVRIFRECRLLLVHLTGYYTPPHWLFFAVTPCNPVHLSCKERKSRTVILLLLLCTSVYKSGIQLIWLRSNHSQGVTGLTASHQNFKAVFQIPFWLKIYSKSHRQSSESRPDVKESSTALRSLMIARNTDHFYKEDNNAMMQRNKKCDFSWICTSFQTE